MEKIPVSETTIIIIKRRKKKKKRGRRVFGGWVWGVESAPRSVRIRRGNKRRRCTINILYISHIYSCLFMLVSVWKQNE